MKSCNFLPIIIHEGDNINSSVQHPELQFVTRRKGHSRRAAIDRSVPRNSPIHLHRMRDLADVTTSHYDVIQKFVEYEHELKCPPTARVHTCECPSGPPQASCFFPLFCSLGSQMLGEYIAICSRYRLRRSGEAQGTQPKHMRCVNVA